MAIAVIASKKDIAGMNIAKQLEALGVAVFYTENELITSENIDKQVASEFIVFISKHKSIEHKKTLSVHPIGNLSGEAKFGGKPLSVVKSSAIALKRMFQILNETAVAMNSHYEITLEATHHGPYIDTPCLFIELGSSEEEWNDQTAAMIIAKSVLMFIAEFPVLQGKGFTPTIGIGGTHYCPNFNKVQLNSDYAISHIIAQYNFPLSKEIIQDAIAKTLEKTNIILLDWKGLGKAKERDALLEIISSIALTTIKTSEMRK
ncbi:MAG: D-aminoacyl-tRNA deacylase [Nanoarchaeota archaeon]